jgi:hypothetical protein
VNQPKLMLHLPATGELLDVKALEEGEVLGLNEAGDILQWGVDIGIYTPQETPEEFGIQNLRAHEVRRINAQPQGSAADPLLYPLSTQDKNTVLAALLHYLEDGLGEPFKRSNEVHRLASGEAEGLNEDISLDQDGVQELLDRLRQSDGIASTALLHLRKFAVKQDRDMSDSSGDGSGTNARPPSGDDWNDLHSEVMATTESLKHVD